MSARLSTRIDSAKKKFNARLNRETERLSANPRFKKRDVSNESLNDRVDLNASIALSKNDSMKGL